MAKVYQGESKNPYGLGSTIYYQWEAEHANMLLDWYRDELMPRFAPSAPIEGGCLVGMRFEAAKVFHETYNDLVVRLRLLKVDNAALTRTVERLTERYNSSQELLGG